MFGIKKQILKLEKPGEKMASSYQIDQIRHTVHAAETHFSALKLNYSIKLITRPWPESEYGKFKRSLYVEQH